MNGCQRLISSGCPARVQRLWSAGLGRDEGAAITAMPDCDRGREPALIQFADVSVLSCQRWPACPLACHCGRLSCCGRMLGTTGRRCFVFPGSRFGSLIFVARLLCPSDGAVCCCVPSCLSPAGSEAQALARTTSGPAPAAACSRAF